MRRVAKGWFAAAATVVLITTAACVPPGTANPAILGTPEVGNELELTLGGWAGGSIWTAVEWFSCPPDEACELVYERPLAKGYGGDGYHLLITDDMVGTEIFAVVEHTDGTVFSTLTTARVGPVGPTNPPHPLDGPLTAPLPAAAASPYLSGDGEHVVYLGEDDDPAAGDSNGFADVYVWDLVADTNTLVSRATDGTQGDADAGTAFCSEDCRYVAFESRATNLVANGVGGGDDVYLRDQVTGTTTLVSAHLGTAEFRSSYVMSISDDGRYVVFMSRATDLVPEDTWDDLDVYLYDHLTGTVTLVSGPSGNAGGRADSWGGAISGDGSTLVFISEQAGLIPNDTDGEPDVILMDIGSGAMERVSVGSDGTPAAVDLTDLAGVSADGRYVTFVSDSAHLGVSGTQDELFRHDRVTGDTTWVSPAFGGGEADRGSRLADISADGQSIYFTSSANDTVSPPKSSIYGNSSSAYVRDVTAAITAPVTLNSYGYLTTGSFAGASDDGRYVAWTGGDIFTTGDREFVILDRGAP